MNELKRVFVASLFAVASLGLPVAADDDGEGPTCKTIEADLVEDLFTVGCKPGHASCFLGVLAGNHGFIGTTYFRGDSGAAGPATSPGFRSYSGIFEYTTAHGTIVARETGVVNVTQGNPESGAVTAHHKILETTGDYVGTTGYLFVSGFSLNNHVVTKIIGQICKP